MSWLTRHKKAIELARLAIIAKESGSHDAARNYFEQAYVLEAAAARLIGRRMDQEPTRSILFRSAATLAVDSGNFEDAERLIFQGLMGSPHYEVEEELRDLLEEVTFQRHLRLRGIVLGEEELQFSVSGDAVAPALMSVNGLLPRIETTSRALIRTAERKRNIPFRTSKDVKGGISRDFEVFWSGDGRPNSVAVTLRIGVPLELQGVQKELLTIPDVSDVVDEFITCVNLTNSGDYVALKERFKDKDYYENWTALAQNMAPDGKSIRAVGFTSTREGGPVTASLRRIPLEITAPPWDEPKNEPVTTREPRTVVGVLRRADDTLKADGSVTIVEEETGAKLTVHVSKAQIDDIVDRHWKKRVQAVITPIGKKKFKLEQMVRLP